MTTSVLPRGGNAEAIAAWDGPLYDRFVRFRPIVTTGLGVHGEHALRLDRPEPGQRVLDIGCGFGDTTQRIAALVGAGGIAVGVRETRAYRTIREPLHVDDVVFALVAGSETE
jgi:SAM-dependent methyltransferase